MITLFFLILEPLDPVVAVDTSARTAARWSAPPDPEAASAVMPQFANMIGVDGVVEYRCIVERSGPPLACRVMSEKPEGLGFAQAGRIVLATGVIEPARSGGRAVPAEIAVRVKFSAYPIEDMPLVRPYEGLEPDADSLVLAEEIVRAAHAAEPIGGAYPLEGLKEDRVAIVRQWFDELTPADIDEKLIKQMARALARWSSIDTLRAMASGEWGEMTMPTLDEQSALMSDYAEPEAQAVLQTIRSRYCARWSCTID